MLAPWKSVTDSLVTRERDACTSLVDAYGSTGVVLSESTLDLRALFLMSEESALATHVLPLCIRDGVLTIASARPLAPAHIDALARHARMKVVVVLASSALLRGAITAAYAAAMRGQVVLAGVQATSRGVHLALIRPSREYALQPDPTAVEP